MKKPKAGWNNFLYIENHYQGQKATYNISENDDAVNYVQVVATILGLPSLTPKLSIPRPKIFFRASNVVTASVPDKYEIFINHGGENGLSIIEVSKTLHDAVKTLSDYATELENGKIQKK